MTLEDFKKRVIKANGYDKYFYYLLFSAAAAAGLFFLYDVIVHHGKYDKFGSRYLGFLAFIFMTTLGISGLFFVPNRYKVITIGSTLSPERKQQVFQKILNEFGDPFCWVDGSFYSFTFNKNWWSVNYKISLTFDTANFYASVQAGSGGYRGSGIIDFGGTEKVRRKLTSILTKMATEQ